jgi:BNR repeat-like domain
MLRSIILILGFVVSMFAKPLSAWPADPHIPPTYTPLVEHVKVYAEPGKFGGWPANHGIWSWGNEILVGFSAGTMKDLGAERHNIDRDKPERHLLARSLDGGQTWSIEDPSEKGALIPSGQALHGIVPPGQQERPWQDCPGGIDFLHPDFAMTIRMTNNHTGPSRFYYSLDRGRNWTGPFRLPDVGTPGISARTDYLVTGREEMLMFVTAGKSDKREGRPLCMRTSDGGKSFQFVAWIGPEPQGYSIMPSTVALSKTELLTAVRCREGNKSWIDCYRSTDSGRSWTLSSAQVANTGEGNPPSLIRLTDGRVCLTYGYRTAPFGIRARLSADGGLTWQDEIHLRDDGGGRDVGYPRTIQRPDGRLVTVYYFHESLAGDRYIAATIWQP